MSVFGLNRAFEPKSLAIVGAGPNPSTLGGAVYANVESALPLPVIPVIET